jgi:ribosome maturation factor RimP
VKRGKITLIDESLQQLLAPTITALGYELFAVERLSQGRRASLLRIYIDRPTGISVRDCEKVSYQVSGILEVEDPISGAYTLEVSSPGLDRPLFTLDHFIRFIGHQITVRLTRPLETRRNFTGLLQRVEGRNVIMVTDGTEYCLPYEQIDKARLVIPDKII